MSRVVHRLANDAPAWLAILGPRKVGKTSLLLEAARRYRTPDLVFVVLDVLDALPVSLDVFRRLAAIVLDAAFAEQSGVALSRAWHDPARYRASLLHAPRFASMPPDLQSLIFELPHRPTDEAFVRDVVDLPESIAVSTGLRFLLCIDEFQELASLGSRSSKLDPIPLLRSRWQLHQRVGYVISGSARTALTELVTSRHSPFFQHFDVLEVGAFRVDDAVQMLTSLAPSDKPIPAAIARRASEVLGGHPFYLQLFGEALTNLAPPYDERSLKEAIQALVFSRTGRLALFFLNEYARDVGKSKGAAATLQALSTGPKRVSEVAHQIGGSTGVAAQYLSRLGDTVRVRKDGAYELVDQVYASWIAWQAPGGSVVSMRAVGDAAELAVAEHLSRMGFDLVYQSRGSRGAFDLLATRGTVQLGVQVKRKKLPLRFSKAEWSRMTADARKWGWRWIVAAVQDDESITLLTPDKASVGKQVRLSERAAVDNLLAWLDETENG